MLALIDKGRTARGAPGLLFVVVGEGAAARRSSWRKPSQTKRH